MFRAQAACLGEPTRAWPGVADFPLYAAHIAGLNPPKEPATAHTLAVRWRPNRPVPEAIAELILRLVAWDPAQRAPAGEVGRLLRERGHGAPGVPAGVATGVSQGAGARQALGDSAGAAALPGQLDVPEPSSYCSRLSASTPSSHKSTLLKGSGKYECTLNCL